ncbi:MAG TPA: cyclic nucleotide-binding domain-containing protein [Thermoanaerobaculia bacterium]|nr:cyclic nucleotide-binding domain-containing protein [Thermoanaerobaculia bacterium]
METEQLVDLLGGTALAAGLEPAEVGRMAEAGEARAVPEGEVLIEEGRRGAALMVILDGEVEVLKRLGNGEVHRLGTLGTGKVLGEVGLVLEEPASATVRTVRPSTLFFLDRRRFRDLVHRRDGTSAVFSIAIAKILATRLQRMNEEVVALCERFEEGQAEAGGNRGSARRAELARFKEQLLSEWNF